MPTADGILSPQQTLPPALPPKSPRLVPVPQRRTISGPPSSTGGDQLQTKLRRLLNTDSKENVFFPDSPTQTIVQTNGIPQEEKFRYSPGSLSPNFREEDRIKVRFLINFEILSNNFLAVMMIYKKICIFRYYLHRVFSFFFFINELSSKCWICYLCNAMRFYNLFKKFKVSYFFFFFYNCRRRKRNDCLNFFV